MLLNVIISIHRPHPRLHYPSLQMCNGYCWQLKNVPFKYVSWHWNISPSHKIRSGTAQYHIKDQLFGFLSALQRIFTGHSLNNKINKCESWCYVCSAQALHDAISPVHICMICLKSPCPQPQLWPIRARLNIYIWLVMYNCTISCWGYALVATTPKNIEALDFRDN